MSHITKKNNIEIDLIVPQIQAGKGFIVFIPILAHAPITTHQCHFQFKICGTINRPLKSSHPVASDYVPSPVLNTKNHQSTLNVNFHCRAILCIITSRFTTTFLDYFPLIFFLKND